MSIGSCTEPWEQARALALDVLRVLWRMVDRRRILCGLRAGWASPRRRCIGRSTCSSSRFRSRRSPARVARGHPLTLLAGVEMAPPIEISRCRRDDQPESTHNGDAILLARWAPRAAWALPSPVIKDGVLASMLPALAHVATTAGIGNGRVDHAMRACYIPCGHTRPCTKWKSVRCGFQCQRSPSQWPLIICLEQPRPIRTADRFHRIGFLLQAACAPARCWRCRQSLPVAAVIALSSIGSAARPGVESFTSSLG